MRVGNGVAIARIGNPVEVNDRSVYTRQNGAQLMNTRNMCLYI